MIPARFHVTVEGVGEFTFRNRTIRDQIWIEAETLRITGGETSDVALKVAAEKIATIARLAIEKPAGFDPEAIDPFDRDDIARLLSVGGALQLAEDGFRGRVAPAKPPVGPGA